jgi:hypothetical protein
MKTALRTGLCLLIAVCVMSFAGCKKKAEPASPAAAEKTEAAKATAPAAEAAKTTAPPAAASALETEPVADVKAEVAKLSVDQLKAKAMEYKNLIMSKKAALEPLTAKLKAIPLTEQMGAEAKGLQNDIAAMNKSISDLTERFQIYYNKIKEMGGDVSGLTL